MIERSGFADDIKAFDKEMESGDVERAKAAISDGFVEDIRQALYASKVVAYAQGFAQMRAAFEGDWWIAAPGVTQYADSRSGATPDSGATVNAQRISR